MVLAIRINATWIDWGLGARVGLCRKLYVSRTQLDDAGRALLIGWEGLSAHLYVLVRL